MTPSNPLLEGSHLVLSRTTLQKTLPSPRTTVLSPQNPRANATAPAMFHRIRLAGWLAGDAPPITVPFLCTAAQKSRRQPRTSLPLLPRPDPPPTRDRPRLAQSEQGRQSNVHADAAIRRY
ncbi:hypothetical protein JMJ78_0000917 [Colletotrichum scovillei]|nr:hypothetical protein JMJ78_0000917 [Colletotrichum scovillei]